MNRVKKSTNIIHLKYNTQVSNKENLSRLVEGWRKITAIKKNIQAVLRRFSFDELRCGQKKLHH